MSTHYDTLGVSPSAPLSVIRAAYKARMRAAHPDAGGSEAESKAVNEAYAVIGEDDTRAAYDRELRSQEPAPAAAAPAAEPASSAGVPAPTRAAAPPQVTIHEPRPYLAHVWALAPVPVWIVLATWTLMVTELTPAVVLVFLSAVAAVFMLARKVLLACVCVVVFLVVTNLMIGQGIPAGYLLIAGLTVGTGLVWGRRRIETDRALVAVDRFHEMILRPGITGWFVSRASHVGDVTQALLTDIDEPAHQVSADIWGTVIPGRYIAIDASMSPAAILEQVGPRDARRAAKTRRRRSNKSKRT